MKWKNMNNSVKMHVISSAALFVSAFISATYHNAFELGDQLPKVWMIYWCMTLAVVNMYFAASIGPKRLFGSLGANAVTYMMFISVLGGPIDTTGQMIIIALLQFSNLSLSIVPEYWAE
jgi:hypothetical protein